MRIATKVLALFLVLSLVPLGILGYTSINRTDSLGDTSKQEVRTLGDNATAAGREALTEIAKEKIRDKAQLVAGQVEYFLELHPDVTLNDIKNYDEGIPQLEEIAVKEVGTSGTTFLVHSDTVEPVVLIHEDITMEGMNLSKQEDVYPDLYKIAKSTFGGKSASGYYRWETAPDIFKEKYVYAEPVDFTTADGENNLTVWASTFMFEFTRPMDQLENTVNETLNETNSEVNQSVTSSRNITLLVFGAMIVIVSAVGFLFARSLVSPIEKLRDAADKISKGDMDVDVTVESEDEIGELSSAFARMKNSLQVTMERLEESE